MSATEVSRGLILAEERRSTLLALIRLQSRGVEVSSVAVDIVRYCLETDSVRQNGIISMSLELLCVQPDHSAWELITKILSELLRNPDERVVSTVLDKASSLPPHVLKAFVLKAGSTIAKLGREGPKNVRYAAIKVICFVCLRMDSLMSSPSNLQKGYTPQTDAILEKDPDALKAALEAMMKVFQNSFTDYDERSSSEVLHTAVQIIQESQKSSNGESVMNRESVEENLFKNVKSIASRIQSLKSILSTRKQTSSLLELAAFVFRNKDSSVDRVEWAVRFMDGPVASLLSAGDPPISLLVAIGGANVCAVADEKHSSLLKKTKQRTLPILVRMAGDSALSPPQVG